MPPKKSNKAGEGPMATHSDQTKGDARPKIIQAETAASSRPRRAPKSTNETLDAPEPIPRPRKRKAEALEEQTTKRKKKGNTKEPAAELGPGEKTATTGDRGNAIEPAAFEDGKDGEVEGLDGKNYWLMKAEPLSRMEKGKDVKFSIDDLEACKEPEGWDGVRNVVARNNMRAMKKDDLAFFYHSNCPTPGIAGTMAIVKEHSVDQSAHDPEHPYYDPKSSEDKPKWSLVHVEYRSKFPHPVTLKELQQHSKEHGSPLESLQTLKQSRLSVSKVSREEWIFINALARSKEETSGSK